MENKLISMTDFVLNLRGKTLNELCIAYPKNFKLPVWKGDQSEMVKDMLAVDAIQWKLTGEYAKFLRQPLTLGMFIPVDVNNEPIPVPQEHLEDRSLYYKELAVYQKGLEKVLFEGFEFRDKVVFAKGVSEPFNLTRFKHLFVDGVVIEDYVDQINDYTITTNALKQIYG